MVFKRGFSSGTHLGHITMMFGFFLGMCSIILQGIVAPQSIAFGTAEIATLSNQRRQDAGLGALTISSTLTSSAQAKANHMAVNGYFAHDAPDGTSPWYFFDNAGYVYMSAGENLALTSQSASNVVQGWFDSDGHRANMLSSDFTEVGYGISMASSIVYDGVTYSNVYLVAAHYAKPYNTIEPTLAPATPAVVQDPPAIEAAPQEIQETSTIDTPAQPPVEPTAPVVETPTAPIGFTAEPENTNRSGELVSVKTNPPEVPKPVALASIGGSGLLITFGGGMEVRRLMKHQSLIPRLHKKR